MKNVLVTGASGYLGSFVCDYFSRHNIPHTPLSSRVCDLTKENSLRAFDHEKYSHIFHLAAWTQAGDFCLKHPGEQWIMNQKINTNVLDFWQVHQPQAKLIFMGTSCSYSPDYALREENYMQGEPIDALYTYAMTKRMLYQGARALSKQYGLKYLCFVPSTLYGPGYHKDGRQMHFIFDLMRKIIRGKELGETVTLWGNGHQKREIIFAPDFVSIMMQLSATKENELYNIGAGEEFSIRTFAEKICDVVGYDASQIIYDENFYTGAKSKCLLVDKITNELKDLNLISLDDGIKQTINWFYEHKVF